MSQEKRSVDPDVTEGAERPRRFKTRRQREDEAQEKDTMKLPRSGFVQHPLFRHALRILIVAPDPVQQLSPSINVALVVGLEVFRQHTDRIASQPPLAAHRRPRLWRTQHLDDLGKSRACAILKAWHVHGNRLWRGKEFSHSTELRGEACQALIESRPR